ncbi:unnamed protein product [Rodentolepis nana]|uniref:Uncharacterized protein n=1 Tax=Rodentolepis nana TaxID=102285 RepID=A0A0R3U0T5_RODNA|nr:unnamed protein product [Rodentolepis nana]
MELLEKETRYNGYTSNKRSLTTTIRPCNLDFTDAFNPNPEYRYPFNSPQSRMSPDKPNGTCQTVTPTSPEATTTPTVGSRLKTCINKFFSYRRSRQPTSPTSSSLKSMSF